MNADDFRVQVRQMLDRRPPRLHTEEPASNVPSGAKGVCVPLRLSRAGDLDVLVELMRRLAASPALAEANAAGLLRFELTVSPALTVAAAAAALPAKAACCDDCARGASCRCTGQPGRQPTPAAATPLLRGCITERDIKALPADCRAVGTAPRAVLTPLARDALRQRGIAVHPTKES